MLRFPSPESFIAGNLSSCLPFWKVILQDHPKAWRSIVIYQMELQCKRFLSLFAACLRGELTTPTLPLKLCFPIAHHAYVSEILLPRLSSKGWLMAPSLFGGKFTRLTLHFLVMPITIKPTKPRMCHDERFLNLWIKDCPCFLDYITDLPRYVAPRHYQTTFDDKSGYDYVRLHPSSFTYSGLQ